MIDQVQEVKDRSDIVEIVSSYLTLKKAGTNYKANCPFHNEKSPSFMISPERQTFKCFGCFPAGQLIETSDGFREIQNIQSGDFVYTSNAQKQKVVLAFERQYQGDLYEISTRMVTQPVFITGDHNVYAIKTKNCKQKSRESRICQRNCHQNCPTKFFDDYKIEKVQARALKVNDYLLYPVKNFNLEKAKTLDLIEYTGATLKRGLKPREFKSIIKISEKFARLAGLYIAEGSNHRAYIRFSFGGHENHLAVEVTKLIKVIFGLDSAIHVRKGGKNGIEVTCCNSLLSRIFVELFGNGSQNKKIPRFFFSHTKIILQSLIGGIIDGDGTISKDQKKSRGGRISIGVVSHELVHQIKDILLTWGIKPSINFRSAYISNTGVNHRPSWKVNWYEQVNANYSDILEIDGIKYWLLPIRSIKQTAFDGPVYNLNIDKDHSYLTPSFMVANCGEGGDVITFIEKIEGLDFYNALKLLAEKAGVQLKTDTVKFGEHEFKADRKTRLFEINEWTKKVYHKVLTDHPKAEKAREYLKKRGLGKKTIEEFEIGYAPASWDFLLRFLVSKKYTEEEIVAAGVAIKAEKGKVYDRFRGRITFPISNIMGNTIAFTSRILEDDGQSAKYINSSESPIYVKGKTIYGLDKAKMVIKEQDAVVMVEGQMDVIACHQAGFKNTVATSGTALTLEQLQILSRYSSVITLSFDGDVAGQTAMKRAIRIAMQNDITTKIIALSKEYKDPDEAIKKDPRLWEEAIKKASPSLKYWIDNLVSQYPDLSIEDKKKIAKEILPVIKITASALEKEHYIRYLSGKLLVSEASLVEALGKTKQDNEFHNTASATSASPKKEQLTPFERIIGLIWADENLISLAKDILADFKTEDARYLSILTMIQTRDFDRNKVKPELAMFLNQVSLSSLENLDINDKELINSEFNYLISRFKSDQREHLRERFAREIQQAEERGDKEAIKKLLSEFSNLIK